MASLRARARSRASAGQARKPIVLKLGGELLEQAEDLGRVARGIAALSTRTPLVVVHGGGKEIDAALAVAGIPKRQVDGLRVTDEPTLDVVVAVLAGAINTRLVAAVRRAGARPVGLTGADATVATVKRAAPITTVAGERVDLGLVGAPVENGRARRARENDRPDERSRGGTADQGRNGEQGDGGQAAGMPRGPGRRCSRRHHRKWTRDDVRRAGG